jgi:RimJ/RimL family protein N-acetyltransferase
MSFEIPTLRTERLVLRAPKIDDFDALCAYYADPRSAFTGGPAQAVDVGRMLMVSLGQWHLRGHGQWHVTLKDTDRFIGFAGVFHPFDWPEPELGYGIVADHEGQGLAYEAAMAARRGAAEHCGLTRLPSFISPENIRSQSLAHRMGAVRDGEVTLRDKPALVFRHPEKGAAA